MNLNGSENNKAPETTRQSDLRRSLIDLRVAVLVKLASRKGAEVDRVKIRLLAEHYSDSEVLHRIHGESSWLQRLSKFFRFRT